MVQKDINNLFFSFFIEETTISKTQQPTQSVTRRDPCRDIASLVAVLTKIK